MSKPVGRNGSVTKCGKTWGPKSVAYRCYTCGNSSGTAFCTDCFRRGNHDGHDFKTYYSFAGGFCDCGDSSAMNVSGFCDQHGTTSVSDPAIDRNGSVKKCGKTWDHKSLAYRCYTCGNSSGTAFCTDCFLRGNHDGHDFKSFYSSGGGFCDCGDSSEMNVSGFCDRHGSHTPTNRTTAERRSMPRLESSTRDATVTSRNKVAGTCLKAWNAKSQAYRCHTCSTSPTMSLCTDCFQRGKHEDHAYEIFVSVGGGFCDCGDPSLMKTSGFCVQHGASTEADKNLAQSMSQESTVDSVDTANTQGSRPLSSDKEGIVSRELECPVCLEQMTPPITLCENGHNICHDCKVQLHNCPICRGAFTNVRNRTAETLATI